MVTTVFTQENVRRLVDSLQRHKEPTRLIVSSSNWEGLVGTQTVTSQEPVVRYVSGPPPVESRRAEELAAYLSAKRRAERRAANKRARQQRRKK